MTTRICQQCGSPNTETSKFCFNCGTVMVASKVEPLIDRPQPLSPQVNWTDAQPATNVAKIRIDQLGTRIDGWADVLLGAGSESQSVANLFEQRLRSQKLPGVTIQQQRLTPGGLIGQERLYRLIQTPTGATMAIYVNSFGNNLFLSWDMYVRPVIRWLIILALFAISALPSFCLFIVSLINSGYFGLIPAFIGPMICAPLTVVTVFVVAGLIGLFFYGSFTTFFIAEIDKFAADDVTAMMIGVHKTLLASVDQAGLKADLLRDKTQYHAGQRARLI